jgi:uncharacterized protein YcnI
MIHHPRDWENFRIKQICREKQREEHCRCAAPSMPPPHDYNTIMKILTLSAVLVLLTVPAFAHVTVAPQQAVAGASQVYKVRVHNDGKTPTASVALQVPDGVVVQGVEKMAAGTADMMKTGDRVTKITWHVEVPVGKYVELAFTATNPASGDRLNWNIAETFTDGTTIEFTDKAGAKEKSSVTKLLPPGTTPAPAK